MGTATKHPVPSDRIRPSYVIFDIRALWPSAMSARVKRTVKSALSKITNDVLTRSGTGCFIAESIWQQWISEIFSLADQSLFSSMQKNSHHVLHRLLPAKSTQPYNLRPRRHSFSLILKNNPVTMTVISSPACYFTTSIDWTISYHYRVYHCSAVRRVIRDYWTNICKVGIKGLTDHSVKTDTVIAIQSVTSHSQYAWRVSLSLLYTGKAWHISVQNDNYDADMMIISQASWLFNK